MKDNILIAKFMGGEVKAQGKVVILNNIKYFTSKEYNKVLKYHSSWDWLMSVVERINTMDNYKYSVHIEYGYCYIEYLVNNEKNYIKRYGEDDTLLAVYDAVINFINWHNTTT